MNTLIHFAYSETGVAEIVALITLLVFIACIGFLIFQIVEVLKRKLGNKERKIIYKILETKKWWRSLKVIYWTMAGIIIFICFIVPHDYSTDDFYLLGMFVLALAYPGYIVFRQVCIYVADIKEKDK